jgi:hypothetical protein
MGRTGREPGLPSAETDATIGQHMDALTCCYQRQLRRDPPLQGSALVAWVVESSGEVSSASPVGNTTGIRSVVDCIGEQVCRWRFPPAKELTKVAHWFRFEAY